MSRKGSADPGFGTFDGEVLSFDPDVGLGTVGSCSGGSWRFHCTAIADGSRVIEVGAAVRFEVGPGGPGRWEAVSVAPRG